MAVNKVVYGQTTLIDLTGDTVTPDTLAEGVTAHDASGNKIVGRMTTAVKWEDIKDVLTPHIGLGVHTDGKVYVFIDGAPVGEGVNCVIEVPNLLDKGDPDMLLTGRFNSSNVAVSYMEGQLCTGYIEAKVGDTFTVVSDKSAKTNGYTGMAVIYDANKSYITMGSQKNVSNQSGYWSWSDDNMTSTLTILPTFWNTDMRGTAWIRFCIAYTDINSIVITKS